MQDRLGGEKGEWSRNAIGNEQRPSNKAFTLRSIKLRVKTVVSRGLSKALGFIPEKLGGVGLFEEDLAWYEKRYNTMWT